MLSRAEDLTYIVWEWRFFHCETCICLANYEPYIIVSLVNTLVSNMMYLDITVAYIHVLVICVIMTEYDIEDLTESSTEHLYIINLKLCMCTCVREMKESERERGRGREREREDILNTQFKVYSSPCSPWKLVNTRLFNLFSSMSEESIL